MARESEHIIHWDDVQRRRIDRAPLQAYWTDLGKASGTVSTGIRRIQVDPGARTTPVHVHGAEEEIFYVLSGSGISWQDGRTHEIREGDCLVHLPQGPAHTLIAGAEGLDVLVYGQRTAAEVAFLPRAHVAWLGPTWVSAGEGGHPWAREAAAGDLELPESSPRPPSIVSQADVPVLSDGRGQYRDDSRELGRAAGSKVIGMVHVMLSDGMASCPLHCHSAEEEIFVILAGTGTCVLADQEYSVRPGHVIARPAGTRVAHMFRGGPEGMTYLACGERDISDVVWYPHSRKLFFRGVGVITRVETVDYWDGEE